jgi:hypothetical protein
MKTRILSNSRILPALLLAAAPLACARGPEEPDHAGSTSTADPRASDGLSPEGKPREDVDTAQVLPLRRTRTLAQGEALMRVAAQVPHAVRSSECGGRVDTDTCAWAQSADALVVATVREVRLTDTPVAGPAEHAEWKWYGTCKKVAPALQIELDVEQDLHAKISGRATVHVGKRQLDRWAPHPSRAADGSLEWNVAEGEVGPLQPGQRVLAALHYVKGQKVWSLMGDMMAAVDGEGVVHTPRGGCLSRLPSELDQKSVPVALERLGACVAGPLGTQGLELRSKRLRAWGEGDTLGAGSHPAKYMAAECLQPDFAPEPVDE